MRKEYIIFACFIIIWTVCAAYSIKYDYKSWPDVPGVNCVNLDAINLPVKK